MHGIKIDYNTIKAKKITIISPHEMSRYANTLLFMAKDYDKVIYEHQARGMIHAHFSSTSKY